MRRRPLVVRRWLFRLASIAAILWVAAIGAMLFFRHDIIYPFRPDAHADLVVGLPGARVVRLEARDATPLITWQVAAQPGRPVILHFTGNAGMLAASAPRLREFALRGYGIVALNYRGAGRAPGAPSERDLIDDALVVYDSIATPPVIYGTSLGAAVAVQVASRRPARALILETPFARLCETAQHHYPLIPACLVMWDERWDSLAAIARVKAPILIQHGDADRIIPLAQARRLYDRAPAPSEFKVYPGGRHNDLRLHGAGIDALDFLDRHLN